MSALEKSKEDLQEYTNQLLQQIDEMSTSAHEMIKSQSHLESILLNAAEGIILFNSDGTVKSLNLAAQRIFGYQEIELMYQHIPHLFNAPQEYNENVPAYLKLYISEHPDTYKEPLSGINNKGETIPLHLTISEVSAIKMEFFDDFSDAIPDVTESENDEINYELFACIFYDLTSEIEAKEEMQRKNSQLEYAYVSLSEYEQLRTEFLAKISHELLTPLNGIIGMADFLIDDIEDSQKEFIQVIQESGLRLEGIISNILAFDKKNDAEISEAPLDLVELLLSYNEKFSKPIQTKNLTFSIDIEDSEDIPVFYTLAVNLRHILDSLIDNAVKFTRTGGVNIKLKVTESDNNLYQTTISIQDTGIGIPKSDQEKIFEPFTQLEDTVTRQYGGIGMGLTIVKQLLESLDYQFDLQSEPEVGTLITLTLVLKTAKEQYLNHVPINKKRLDELKQLLDDDFELLIEASQKDLLSNFEKLMLYMEEHNEKCIFASCTLLKNIAEHLGAQHLINKIDEFHNQYVKHQKTDASRDRLFVLAEEISEEINEIKKALKDY